MARLDGVLPWVQAAALAGYAFAQLLLVAYAFHRLLVLWRWRRGRRRSRPQGPPGSRFRPRITVQLPVYNERRVNERLIDAVAAFDYPRNLLEIQVLDDSTDETRDRAARRIGRHRARGLDIHHLVRERRTGFKAGALAAGLERARGELIAVFDADFLPPPDFLDRATHWFEDPSVGMVQGRWTHLNRDASCLTAAQAVMLDAHFLLEQASRMDARLFFNFNGTAGILRRACIEQAGGWSHDTLTEDLDLSYRAQLSGWRFVFDPRLEAPAELPSDIEALMSQQRRWVKGSVQTARKLLPALLRSPLPWRVKLEGLFHLTGNAAYLLLVTLALLLLPLLAAPPRDAGPGFGVVQAGVVALVVIPVIAFLAIGRFGQSGSLGQRLRDLGAAVLLGIGLSANNGRAVLEGLAGPVGDWERTPKTGEGAQVAANGGGLYARGARGGGTELLLALYAASLAPLAWAAGHAGALPFLVLLAAGFGWVGVSARGRLRAVSARETPTGG